ncbi:MAG: glutathione S-transferase family protein [Pseudomonadota bacterium]
MMSTLVLTGADYSVYTRIARMALVQKGIDYRLDECDVFEEADRAALGKRHPFGKIPVLDHAGKTVIETQAILRYFDAVFPDKPLFPREAGDVARSEQAISVVTNYAYPCLVWQIFVPWYRAMDEDPGKAGDGRPVDETVSKTALTCLDVLDRLIADTSWFSGRSFGAADSYVYAVLAYFRCVPWGLAACGGYPNLAAWFGLARNQPGPVATPYPREARRAE